VIPTEETVLADLIRLMQGLTDWEYSGTISRQSWLFADLRIESVETVALFGIIQRYYRRRFPFGEFLAELEKRKQRDIRLGDLVDFLRRHLDSPARAGLPEGPA